MTSSKNRAPLRKSQREALLALVAADKPATAPEVAKIAHLQGTDLSVTSIRQLLSSLRQHVSYRTINGVRRFTVTNLGRQYAESLKEHENTEANGQFILPGTPWSSRREFGEILRERETEKILLVDPYISEDTLDLVAMVPAETLILTAHAGRKGAEERFQRELARLNRERASYAKPITVRVALKTDLHGRYLFGRNGSWIIDHSIHNLGDKPALILPLADSPLCNQARVYFEQLFEKSRPLDIK